MAAVLKLRYTLFFIHFLCHWINSNAINLDARFSVIKTGDADSYFGYSVAQHQIVDENNPKTILQNVFLIGAPNLDKRGGAIYRCDASTTSQDCLKVTDGVQLIEDNSSAGLAASRKAEQQGQWFGVSVASQGTGKKTVACAHRYLRDNSAVGVCYTFFQDFEFRSPHMPCTGKPYKRYMQNFGLCQAGMAVSMEKGDSLLMGAPGSIFWQGAVFMTNVSEVLGTSQSELVSPYTNPQQVTGNQQPTPTKSYTYQGYALTMGQFDKSKDVYYVSGAPKGGNAKGSVVLYKVFDLPTRNLRYDKNHIINGFVPFSGFGSSLLAVDINNDGFDDLIVGAPYYYARNRGGAFYVYLGGEEMFNGKTVPTEVVSRKLGDLECKAIKCEHARFGISLAKLGDVNMDSYQDFAVGAPYEGNGAVYIYHGQKNKPGFKLDYVQRIAASDLPNGLSNFWSFGHSLSGGMDLDNNGYPDLLVGAYESDVVALIRSRPIIRIHPRMDVRPTLIDLEGSQSCNLDGVLDENRNRLCVGVEICLNFTTKPEDSIQLVPNVVYSLEAERNRRVARVELQDAVDASHRVVKGKTIQLKDSGDVCATEIAFIKGKFEDKLNPIEFSFTFHLSSDDKEPSPYPTSATQDINTFPILDTQWGSQHGDLATDIAIQVDFVKECGDDQECHSNLQFETTLLELPKDDEGNYEMVIQKKNEIRMSVSVDNEGEAAYLTRIFIQKPPLVTYLDTLKDETSSVTCQIVPDDDTMIKCDQIGNPLRTGKSVSFEIVLDVPKALADSTDLYNFTAWVNTSSKEQTPLNDKLVMNFRVVNKAEITLSTYVSPDNSILCKGEPRGFNAIKDETDIGHSVTHNFLIRNFGPGVVSESYITISWPYEVGGDDGGDGKYLLYLMRKPKVIGPVVQCNYKDIEQYINPLGIQEVIKEDGEASTGASMDPSNLVMYENAGEDSDLEVMMSESKSRTKREAETGKKGGKVFIMSCLDKTAKCFQFKCKLGKMESRSSVVQITMESRLWESTLLLNYRKASDVQIISWGNITLPKKLMIQQDASDDVKRAVTRAIPELKESSEKDMILWIILGGVIAALLLLVVVIFVLYKCGCFRSKTHDEMRMYKAEKKQHAMLSDYDDRDL